MVFHRIWVSWSSVLLAALLTSSVSGLPLQTPTFQVDNAKPAQEPAVVTKSGIEWQKSFAAARQKAVAGQVIFVDVYTHWCSWCRYMDNQVYPNPSVQDFASRNVFVRLDAEDGLEGTQMAQALRVRSYPTLLVYASDGRMIAKQIGAFKKPDDFVSWLNRSAGRQ